jgi:hypothetical protein
MRFFAISYFFIPLGLLATRAVAQVDLFPGHFGQVMLARQLLNPGISNIERATNVTFSNKFYTGPYSKIDNLYFIGNVNLNGKDSARNVNSIGLKFVNEKEGEFIERPKYYINYSFRTRLFQDYWLALGVDVGRAAYIFKGTGVSTEGSASNWDGNLGIVLHSPRLCLAGSMNQFFNSLVLPKDLYFRWRRFYTLYAEKSFEIGTSELSLYAQNQFLPDHTDVLDMGANLYISNLFFLATNIWMDRSVSFVVGLKNISLEDHHFSLYMGYNVPAFNQTSANIQSFEMSLYYQFR